MIPIWIAKSRGSESLIDDAKVAELNSSNHYDEEEVKNEGNHVEREPAKESGKPT